MSHQPARRASLAAFLAVFALVLLTMFGFGVWSVPSLHAQGTFPPRAYLPMVFSPPTDGGTLTAARESHTATLLPSGKVLVAGGTSDPNGFLPPLASAELYDPGSNSWSVAPSLTQARTSHTATLLPSGKVLVIGGDALGVPLTSTEVYDPGANTWTMMASMTVGRTAHTATLLASGKVLVAGGHNPACNATSQVCASAEIYDPSTNTWSSAGTMNVARQHHTATRLPSGQVLVTGGFICGVTQPGSCNSAEIYDPSNNSWTLVANMNATRYRHTATLLPSGQVLVVGGIGEGPGCTSFECASAEVYDPASNTWSAAGTMSTARDSHTATLLASGKVLVAGGTLSTDARTPHFIASAELYDPATNSWSPAGNLRYGRFYHTATLLPGGQVLAAGGISQSGINIVALDNAELYDPARNGW